jgi:hypothetical protein
MAPENELVGRLYPESAWTFVWARRVLRDFLGDRVSRFLVGRREPGGWSVLREDDAWLAVHDADGTAPAHTAAFPSAQDAVAHAAAGLIVDSGASIHEDLLREQGVLAHVWDDARKRLVLTVTDEGRELVAASQDDGRPRYGDSGIVLDRVIERPRGYQVIPRVPRTADGLFIGAHEFFAAHVRSRLPGDFAASTGEELPAGTLLDTFAPADEPYLFTLETPFERRGLCGTGRNLVRRFFVVRRPLLVHPGFPVRETTIPARGPSDRGQGYLLPRTVTAEIEAGGIAQITEAETLRIYREQRAATGNGR